MLFRVKTTNLRCILKPERGNIDLGDRVRILLNRDQKRAAIEPQQIEELLGIPVLLSLPNDYQAVNRALTSGKNVDSSTELGKQFTKLANILFERKVPQQVLKSRRFVEYFSLLPGMFQDPKKSTGA